ncbi:chromobox protein homolog 3 [Ischnura elegans]|uniref:chromobox protein homolog 3 n=1 Tax=Ischnura elegans TaxID=197161 RepID=UPI001ED88169|nr:chromobox protein homolog 3 [Ischnura elegans]
MRRLAKNKRKISESNSEVKQENGDATETSPVVPESTRPLKTRKSRSYNEKETPAKRIKRDDDEPLCREPEKVVDSRINRKKVQYKVRWKNFSAKEDTWEYPDEINPELIEAFENAKGDEKAEETEEKPTPRPRKSHPPPVQPPETVVKVQKARAKVGRGYEVESILAVRTVKNKRKYKVHWKGFSSEDDSWVSENELSCPEILQDFLRRQKEKRNLPTPISVDSDSEEYEVEKVIEVRFKKSGAREFLIRWKGFSSKDDTWEPEENLSCPDLIAKFMTKVEKAKNATIRELRTNPVMTDRLTYNTKKTRHSLRPQTQNRPKYHSYLE